MKRTWHMVLVLSLGILLTLSGGGSGQTVPRSPSAVKVDGVLSDWEGVELVSLGGKGIEVYLSYDAARLYLAVAVPDETVIVDKLTSNFSQGDFVRFGLALNAEGTKASKSDEVPYVFTISPPTDFGQPLVALETANKSQLTFDLRDVEVGGSVSKQGYAIEASFPAKAFGLARFRGGQRLRVNVLVQDTDGKKTRVSTLDGSGGWIECSRWPIVELSR